MLSRLGLKQTLRETLFQKVVCTFYSSRIGKRGENQCENVSCCCKLFGETGEKQECELMACI